MHEGTSARRCTVERPDRTFCDALGLPGAPFPICRKHAAQLYGYVRDLAVQVPTARELQRQRPDQLARVGRGPVVYYLRIGSDYKIGYTANLRRRLQAYPPSAEILAVEPGGRDVERRRHQQFAHLLVNRAEWFHPGPDLVIHIARLAGRVDVRVII